MTLEADRLWINQDQETKSCVSRVAFPMLLMDFDIQSMLCDDFGRQQEECQWSKFGIVCEDLEPRCHDNGKNYFMVWWQWTLCCISFPSRKMSVTHFQKGEHCLW